MKNLKSIFGIAVLMAAAVLILSLGKITQPVQIKQGAETDTHLATNVAGGIVVTGNLKPPTFNSSVE